MAVRAKDDDARAFYERLGFMPAPTDLYHGFVLLKAFAPSFKRQLPRLPRWHQRPARPVEAMAPAERNAAASKETRLLHALYGTTDLTLFTTMLSKATPQT
jgi:hypothetical protein